MVFVLQVARGRRSQNRGRLRNNGSVADHAADFFHQILGDGNVFGRAPARDCKEELTRVELLDAEDQRLKDVNDFFCRELAPQFARGPVDIKLDPRRR